MPIVNVEAEQYLIGCLLYEGDLVKEVSLQPEHFHIPKHKDIYQAIKHVEAKDEKVDMLTVLTALGEKTSQIGGIDYLMELQTSIPTVENFQTYEKYVLDAWKLRQSEQLANKLKLEVAASSETKIITETIQNLSRIEETGFNDDFDLKEVMMQTYEEFETEQEGLSGIDTGFTDLNHMTNGWQDEELIIIGARPSMGKTAFALNTAIRAVMRDTVTVIFSLEMSDKSLLKRIYGAMGNINAIKFRNPRKLFAQDDWQKLTETMGQLSGKPLYIYDKPAVTVQEIRSKLRKLKRKHPNNKFLCVIDYLTLIQGSGKENRTLEVGEISRNLKIMSRDFKMPIIALSQLSRGVEQRQDKRPMMSDLRDSGSVEQDADVIAFLYRDDYYDAESEKPNVTEIILAKQRNGPIGTVELAFLKEYGKFVNLARG
jgi:replicative DNA helicase